MLHSEVGLPSRRRRNGGEAIGVGDQQRVNKKTGCMPPDERHRGCRKVGRQPTEHEREEQKPKCAPEPTQRNVSGPREQNRQQKNQSGIYWWHLLIACSGTYSAEQFLAQ